MRDGEPSVYAALATTRSGYVQGQWSRLQLFLAFNAIAMPIVIGSQQKPLIKLLLSAVGVLIHIAVLQGSLRANQWTKFWDKKLKALEELDIASKSEASIRVRIFSDPEFELRRKSKFATRFLFVPFAILVVGFWVFVFCGNLYLYLISP